MFRGFTSEWNAIHKHHTIVIKLQINNSCTRLFELYWTDAFKKEVKDKDYCPIEIIKGLTDKGQFQYLTKLMGPQEGTYLYATQFHSLR